MYSSEPYLVGQLLPAAAFILVVGFFVSLTVTRAPHWSMFVALAKTLVFIAYFGVFYDGTFTFLDDWTYLERGKEIFAEDINIGNFWAHLPQLFTTAGGMHFFYYLVNAEAMRLFGLVYYAPVAFNIVMTFVAGGFLHAAARTGLGLPPRLALGLFVFYVLHPSLIAWSTVMNGKDILVAMGTAMAVFGVSQLQTQHYKLAVISAVFIGLVLTFTRFYVPLILLGALLGAVLASPGMGKKPFIWLLGVLGLIGITAVLGVGRLEAALASFQEGFVNPLYGIVRFTMTPVPFNTDASYAFLDMPQIFHWTLMPIMLIGVVRLWLQATLTGRFIVIYFALMLLLYGMFRELQGPRHRVQIDGLIALFQFYGAVGILRHIVSFSQNHARKS